MPWSAMLGPVLLSQTWIVDDDGGPGVQFTDLPPAVAAAADGDLLLVQPGTYSHFTLAGKGLRILGPVAGGAQVTIATAGNSSIVIGPIPPASHAFVDRIDFSSGSIYSTAIVRVFGADTRATFADVTISGQGSSRLPLEVVAAEVHFARCTLLAPDGPPPGLTGSNAAIGAAFFLLGARASLSTCSVVGGDALPTPCPVLLFPDGGAAIRLQEVTAWVADSTVLGGAAACCSSGFPFCGVGGTGIASSALSVPAFLRVSGDSSSLVRGGDAASPAFPPGAGLVAGGSASTVEVHSVAVVGGCATLSPCVPGPATQGTGTIALDSIPLPVLRVAGNLTTSGSATISLSNGPPGAPFLVAASGSAGYASAGPLFVGEILIDPMNWFPLLAGSLTGSGDFTVTIPLAGIAPSLLHTPFHRQGVALDPGGAFWRVSNSTVAVVRP